nr:anthranilate synthase [Raoultella sp. NCTC 9187]
MPRRSRVLTTRLPISSAPARRQQQHQYLYRQRGLWRSLRAEGRENTVNRSVSSKSGSSDLLAAFGINLDMNADKSRTALDELGVCFLFAPKYHTGFRPRDAGPSAAEDPDAV